MADFRRVIPVLALLALILGSAFTANAQVTAAFQCVANAGVPPLMRSEGLTEKAGDVVLNCTGGVPTAVGVPVPGVNIQIFLNTAVTSRLLAGSIWTEALLMIDEPGGAANPGTPQLVCGGPGTTETFAGSGVCTGITGTGTGVGVYSGVLGRANVYQGQLAGSNSIAYLGVPIDPPGTTATRVIRITNVRANANALGVAGANAPPTPVIETITASGSTSIPINNPQQVVGNVLKGLTTAIRNRANDTTLTAPVTFQQCFTINNLPSSIAAGTNFFVRFQENFATAFKRRTIGVNLTGGGIGTSVTVPGSSVNSEISPAVVPQAVPGAIYDSETGFYNPAFPTVTNGSNTGVAGLADFGTRVKIVFNNVPNGANVFVGIKVVAGALVLRLTSSETGAFSAVAATASAGGFFQVPITTGSGTAVYEVINSDPFALETADIPVAIGFAASPGTGSPALGTGGINASFAPTSTVTTASTGPIPRFADTSTLMNTFSINACVTNLLFPFVTNQFGFDTGLAIANTSTDPFGTSAQAGTCTLNFYGANAPAAFTSASVASGTVYTDLASTRSPNFSGYIIAQCRFQFAHGFAFVSDVGARNLAMGYLALIIPDIGGTRLPNPFDLAGPGSGEQLGY